jgi:selenocysteine lyase/cysteine desulfurase
VDPSSRFGVAVEIVEAQKLFEPDGVYLNTATYGLPPRPAVEAIDAVMDDWRHGRTSWEPWAEQTEVARASFARLVNASVEDVAQGTTVSEFVGLVAASLPDGARVVTPNIDFTSAMFPFMVHADRGITVETVPSAELVDAITPGTACVSFSAVQSATGEVADLGAIIRAAHDAGAITVCDATQAVGWLPIDATRFDVLVTHAYKWLLSPRSAVLCFIREELRDRLRPLFAGWFAGEDTGESRYGPPLRLALNARRFDLSPAWFSWVGAAPALALIEDLGVEKIRDHDIALANRFRAGLGLDPSNSAIVRVEVPGAAKALEGAGIHAAVRAGTLRVSFHLYNTETDVDAALETLSRPTHG